MDDDYLKLAKLYLESQRDNEDSDPAEVAIACALIAIAERLPAPAQGKDR